MAFSDIVSQVRQDVTGRGLINNRTFLMIDNYIYLHHVNKYIVLPSFIDSVTDSQAVQFSSTTPLARSSPIYSFSHSGPRSVQVSFDLHRDLLQDLNRSNTSIELAGNELTDDYVDLLIKYIQAAALPSYEESDKMVNPPLVSMRLGNDIYIKGVINNSVGITYVYPILSNGRYANVRIGFSISEVDPYDANMVLRTGSFRNLNTSLVRAGDVFTDTSSEGTSTNSGGRADTNSNKQVNNGNRGASNPNYGANRSGTNSSNSADNTRGANNPNYNANRGNNSSGSGQTAGSGAGRTDNYYVEYPNKYIPDSENFNIIKQYIIKFYTDTYYNYPKEVINSIKEYINAISFSTKTTFNQLKLEVGNYIQSIIGNYGGKTSGKGSGRT